MLDEETSAQAENIAEALQQLKGQVRRQRLELESSFPPGAAPRPEIAWPPALERVHAAARINPHQPIAWPTWPPGLGPKIVAAMQKVVRRLLRWYINPIVEQQNHFNLAVAQSLDLLWQEISSLKIQNSEGRDGPEGS